MQEIVMKRMLNVKSLSSQVKKKCFKKMVNEDLEANIIFELSIEMGSTVEETKNMIIKHCTD